MVKIKGWWLPTQNVQQLVIVGTLRNLTQHYVPNFRQSVACLAPLECILCEKKIPIQSLNALPVKLPENEEIYLLRIYPNQQHVLSLLLSGGVDLIGRVIQVEKAPGAIKLRSLMNLTKKQVPASPAPIDNYLRNIGKKAYDRMSLDVEFQARIDL